MFFTGGIKVKRKNKGYSIKNIYLFYLNSVTTLDGNHGTWLGLENYFFSGTTAPQGHLLYPNPTLIFFTHSSIYIQLPLLIIWKKAVEQNSINKKYNYCQLAHLLQQINE